jgi:chromosome partitioning protein
MGKVIPVVNQKGGVAKSTTVVNLSHALARKGKRVLAIDADPQASLTIYFGQDPRHLEEMQQTLYHGLLKNKSLSELVIPGNPALIPASIMLSKADPELMSEPSSSWVLKEKLNGLLDEYDFILIDCPPTLTLLTLNALSAGNLAIIPAKTDNLSVMGIPLLLETIDKIQKRGNSQLKIFGILPTLYHARNVHDQDILEALKTAFSGKTRVFEPISHSTNFDKSTSLGQPTLLAFPETPGVENYYKLAEELINQE